MKIKAVYDQGTAKYTEDFPIYFPGKVLGVLDTGSGVFIPPAKQKKFYGMTGGQLTGGIINGAIGTCFLTGLLEPEKDLKTINLALAQLFEHEKLNLAEQGDNPFASYALAFFVGEKIEIIQGGDCQFIWQNRDGSIEWTRNQTLDYDGENLRLIANAMGIAKNQYLIRTDKNDADLLEADIGIIRNMMWQIFGPLLKKRRNEYFNSPAGGFSLLNGHKNFYLYWQKRILNPNKVKTLIGYTDGFVNQPATADMERLALEIIKAYQNGGLQTILNNTRIIAEANKAETHITHPEATAIAIEL